MQIEHLRIISKDRGVGNSWNYKGSEWRKGNLIYIRVFDVLYSEYHDIDIQSPEECEKLLIAYVTDNPSYRSLKKALTK